MRLPDLLATRRGRLTAFFFLYVTEGIPLGFAATAVATQLRRQDVGPAEIGAFVASFYLPWAFKWAFGPFIDTFTSARWGKRRGWILGTQLMLVLTLLACTMLDLPAQLGLLTAVLLVHNTFGAMQDVAIDALAVSTLHEDERGLANGVMFGGAALGMALGGSGVLFMMDWMGLTGGFVFVAACIAAVTVFVVLPLKERDDGAVARAAGLASAGRAMRNFGVEAFRSFLGTRGAWSGLGFALLPAGAMSLGLALQSNLAVEVGMSDDDIAWLSLWSQVISAACMVFGGWLSDRWGRGRTLAVYMALMSLPVWWLASQLQTHGWVMPAAADVRQAAPVAVVMAVWVATLSYSVAQGLMYGTRSAIMMDVTNPAVAATQFTAYMALMNLAIAYSATWQGIAIEALGYPKTLLIDGILGLLCIALLPMIRPSRTPRGDGLGARRARSLAGVLALGCVLWLPYRAGAFEAGAAAPIFETLFTLVFVAAAVFLAAGAATLGTAGNAAARVGLVLAPLLLAMYARRWWPQLELLYYAVPAVAALVLLALARQRWQTLHVEPAAAA